MADYVRNVFSPTPDVILQSSHRSQAEITSVLFGSRWLLSPSRSAMYSESISAILQYSTDDESRHRC